MLDLSYAKSTTSKTFTCRATVIVAVGSAIKPNTIVTGTWSVVNGTMARFPYSVQPRTSNKGGDMGAAISTSFKINNANQGCRFVITNLEVPMEALKREVLISQALAL
jgi:hypothetical protein